jgi:hypothetical protein
MRALFLVLGLMVMVAAPASAADGVKIRTGADGKKIYVAPPLVVHGKAHQPEAVFVMPRAKFTYEWPELRREPAATPDPGSASAR